MGCTSDNSLVNDSVYHSDYTMDILRVDRSAYSMGCTSDNSSVNDSVYRSDYTMDIPWVDHSVDASGGHSDPPKDGHWVALMDTKAF